MTDRLTLTELNDLAEKHLLEIGNETTTPSEKLVVLALMTHANIMADVTKFLKARGELLR